MLVTGRAGRGEGAGIGEILQDDQAARGSGRVESTEEGASLP
ncbi:unnamed protein product [Pararhodospirillum photometricum DSM 122]|uniref:Uncharacterized protein n=1 Tax=Pararhodospirillum photometricum DSM 122 TaxID=1150469 RepID=H6SRG7_PARPM|nr:unnamed protein product [Pararhodospirillum photometricum DSM 122]